MANISLSVLQSVACNSSNDFAATVRLIFFVLTKSTRGLGALRFRTNRLT